MDDVWHQVELELDKDVWRAGEVIRGHALVDNVDNVKIRHIRVHLRARGHVEWKIIHAGDWRTVKDDEKYLSVQSILWPPAAESGTNGVSNHNNNSSSSGVGGVGGGGGSSSTAILPRGQHKLAFEFSLPHSRLPPSFESRTCYIRYYIRLVIDIPYASRPANVKYFTVIGPQLEGQWDNSHFVPLRYQVDRPLSGMKTFLGSCCCCVPGLSRRGRPGYAVSLIAQLDRSVYCCGEGIQLTCEVYNETMHRVAVVVRILQKVQYFIDRALLSINKALHYTPLEYRTEFLSGRGAVHQLDLQRHLPVPVMPPSLNVDYCRLLQIHYVLRVFLLTEGKSPTSTTSGHRSSRHQSAIDFPLIVSTQPCQALFPDDVASCSEAVTTCHRIPIENVEGGNYISTQFRLGHVYDGVEGQMRELDDVVLYRPHYVCVNESTLPNHDSHFHKGGGAGGAGGAHKEKGDMNHVIVSSL